MQAAARLLPSISKDVCQLGDAGQQATENFQVCIVDDQGALRSMGKGKGGMP